MKYLFLIFAIAGCLRAGLMNAQASEAAKRENIDEFSRMVSDFKKAKDSEKVDKAIEIASLAQKIPVLASRGSITPKQKLEALIKSLEIVSSLEIGDFKFSDGPQLHVMPPSNSGVDAGSDPSAIKDPTLRAQYEAAIAANRLKATIYNNQVKLRAKRESLVNSIKVLISNQAGLKKDENYLGMIKELSSSGALKKALLSE